MNTSQCAVYNSCSRALEALRARAKELPNEYVDFELELIPNCIRDLEALLEAYDK